MSDSGSDIIIKGGSVELSYDDAIYVKEEGGDPKARKNRDRNIIQIIVTTATEEVLFDSGEFPEGLKYTVKARCR